MSEYDFLEALFAMQTVSYYTFIERGKWFDDTAAHHHHHTCTPPPPPHKLTCVGDVMVIFKIARSQLLSSSLEMYA